MVCYLVSKFLTALKIKFNLNVILQPVKDYGKYTATWGPNVQTPRGLTVIFVSNIFCTSVKVCKCALAAVSVVFA